MSVTTFETTQNAPESKHHKMKLFIEAAKEYLQTRAEDTATLIVRHLQALSVTIDLSVFDPHTSVVSEFFVSLHELLCNVEQRCSFCWYCVDVLSNACRNPSARNALIHTYQFLPLLSRLLGDHMSLEKKQRVLNLMQELTCGIKISWQIPHLAHLMSTLTRWVESDNMDIVTLSLGVLVNLCYKNLPAVYTLSRCVDLKKFIRTCMPLQGVKVEVHVCKLLIILEHMNGKVPETAILKLIDVTFKSIVEAFKVKDSILLRHIVEFFLDIMHAKAQTNCFAIYGSYDVEIEKLLTVVECNSHDNSSGECPDQDPESMAIVFEFIHSLLELRLPKLDCLYPRLVHVALKWIQTDIVCSQALAILRTVAVTSDNMDQSVLQPLISGLPLFLFALNNGDEEIPTHTEHNKRLAALLQLLRALVQSDFVRSRVMADLKEETLWKVFVPVLGTNNSPRLRASDADTHSSEAINLYIHAIAFVHELAKYDTEWITTHSNLMQQKQIHMILAQGLYIGSKEVKDLILSMASTKLFPTSQIASAMANLQPLVQIDEPSNVDSNTQIADSMCFPIMSVAQAEQLDAVMNRLKESMVQNNMMNISTSDVMELYEYKLASMGHAERAAMASVEAASQRCTHLQHRTAQLTAELTRLHQLLFHSQQCQENAIKLKNSLAESNKDLSMKLEGEKGRYIACSSQLKIKEKALSETEANLKDATKKLSEIEEIKILLEEDNKELKQTMSKLEDNLLRKEKLAEKKEEILSKANMQNENLRMQVVQLERQLKQTETELLARNNELKDISKELEIKRHILNTITKVANSST